MCYISAVSDRRKKCKFRRLETTKLGRLSAATGQKTSSLAYKGGIPWVAGLVYFGPLQVEHAACLVLLAAIFGFRKEKRWR